MDPSLKERLMAIVGTESFSEELVDIVCSSYDASDHWERPWAVLWPKSTQEISRILKLANAEGFPVIPRGAGTGLAGGAVPVRGGIVLDLCRMNRILEIRVQDRLAVVQPGVVYADFQKALAPHGFFFPPDPASGAVCTLGGNVATNAGGLKGAKYGVTKDYVLGLEVVLPTGGILRTGSRCMKSVSGYDLTRLFVGSEGTLGVVCEITFRIHPRPGASLTALAFFRGLGDAGAAIAGIMRSGIIPSALELLDEESLRVLREKAAMDLPEAGAMILAETDGDTQAEARYQMERVMEQFRQHEAIRIRTADPGPEAEALWKARRSVGSAAGQLAADFVSEDVTVPVSRIPELLTRIARILRQSGLPYVIFAHAGDGNLHPKIMYDRSDPEQAGRIRRAVDEIFRLTCAMGGTLTGEHGVGLEKAPYMSLEHDPAALGVMRGIKRLLDPRNVLNPGKMALDS